MKDNVQLSQTDHLTKDSIESNHTRKTNREKIVIKKVNPRNRAMLILYIGIVLFVIYCIFIAAKILPYQQPGIKYVVAHLSLDDTNSNDYEVTEKEDTRGSHGDGHVKVILQLNETAAASLNTQIQSQLTEQSDEQLDEWSALPLNEDLELLLYGGTNGNSSYCYNFAKNAEIPLPANGYYKFLDTSDCLAQQWILSRSSYDFCFCIYDCDTLKLYYLEIHT